MKSKLLSSIVIVAFSLISFSGCTDAKANKKKNDSVLQNQEEQFESMGTFYEAVMFPEKSFSLSEHNQNQIRELLKKSDLEKDPITLIKVLAWSDQEYPDEDDDVLTPKDMELASSRGSAVKDFIQTELDRNEMIKVFNMAQRPNFFSELAKNDEYETKEAFEEAGPTFTLLPNGDISYTKASKVIVIIDYENKY